MKVLFIGGTGNISSSVTELAVSKGIELYHLNRGNRPSVEGVKQITGDINSENIYDVLADHNWDVVVNWIVFKPHELERDFHLFKGRTKQYIFISSASCYQKPPIEPIYTENTPLTNPHWDYSRDKIDCENLLQSYIKEHQFPATIVRPSHTYNTALPVSIGAWDEYTIVDRIKKDKPIVVQGDGTSLWTITHASDFAVGFIGLFNREEAIGQAYHITGEETLTWNQIYQAMGAALGKVPRLIHIPSWSIIRYAEEIGYPSEEGGLWGDKSHCALFDNSKIKNLVPEFRTTIPFAEGIKKTIAWFEADSSRQLIRPETDKYMDGLVERFG
jgi:nucleoside-diphosphate-sugar epimerase